MKKNLAIFSLITLVFSALAPVSINTQAALIPESFIDISDVVTPPVKVPEKEDKNPVDVSDVKSAPVIDKAPNTETDVVLPEIEVPEVPKLIISKTVNSSYTRSWNWSIEKTANISNLGTVDASDVETVSYTITPTAVAQDSNHKVYGTITITNPHANAATISSITDVMNVAGPVSIDCGVTISGYVLMPNSTLNCSYVSTSSLADTQNTVTVITTGTIEGGIATAPVAWGQPATEYDKCITITDSHPAGPQKAKYCIEGQKVDLTYDLTFSKDGEADVPLVCGANEFTNTVQFTSNNTKFIESSDWKVVVSDSASKFPKIGSDDWTVTANIDCAPPSGGGGGSGGGSGGGGGGFIPTNVTNTPPTTDSTTPDQQVLGEQRFVDDPTNPQVLGVQVTAAPSFPKTGSGPVNSTNNIYSYLMSGLMLLAATWMAYSRKEFSLSSK